MGNHPLTSKTPIQTANPNRAGRNLGCPVQRGPPNTWNLVAAGQNIAVVEGKESGGAAPRQARDKPFPTGSLHWARAPGNKRPAAALGHAQPRSRARVLAASLHHGSRAQSRTRARAQAKPVHVDIRIRRAVRRRCVSFCLCLSAGIFLCFCLSVGLSVSGICFFVCLSVCLSVSVCLCLFVCVCLCLCLCLSVSV